MVIENKTCSICESSDWKSLDYLRDQKYWYERDLLIDEPVGFKICKNCGFVTYDYTDDVELRRRYDNLVKIVDVGSIVSKNRKLAYHRKFLKDFNKTIKSALDYGCATGYFLKEIKESWNSDVTVHGVETSDILKKFAKNEYHIDAYDTIPDNKYNFISCYHVIEHIQYPDKLMKQFNEHLNDNGYLYISVPEIIQHAILDEPSGMMASEFEELYHLNHVNQFSKVSLRNLLNKSGFQIVKEDDQMYGYTVLCTKTEPGIIQKENYLDIVSLIEKQKKAMELFITEKFEEARKVFPGYPDAWVMNAIKNFKDLHEQERVLKEALEPTGNHYKIRKQLAYLYNQWDENKAKESNITNHVKQSKALFEQLAQEKPGQEDFLYYLAIQEMRYYKNYEKSREYLDMILDINPAKYGEVINLVGLMWKTKE
jgi:2-polyprenyl-3-methyl-5-hydroxy-6-metoxy-1,4-benzoquinol methylase